MGSNSKTYLLRRLARDFPEALDRLEAGEFKSARQAAIAYGIVKVKPTVTLGDDPQTVAKVIFDKMGVELCDIHHKRMGKKTGYVGSGEAESGDP